MEVTRWSGHSGEISHVRNDRQETGGARRQSTLPFPSWVAWLAGIHKHVSQRMLCTRPTACVYGHKSTDLASGRVCYIRRRPPHQKPRGSLAGISYRPEFPEISKRLSCRALARAARLYSQSFDYRGAGAVSAISVRSSMTCQTSSLA